MDEFEELRKIQKEQKKPDFDTVMFNADLLDEDVHPDSIQHFLLAASKLPAIQERMVLERIRKNTGIPLHKLEQAISEDAGPDSKKPDQHDLAMAVLERHGRNNFLATTAHTFQWDSAGAWRIIDDRALKKIIQDVLIEITEVSRGLVDAVMEVLKTEIYIPRHEWSYDPTVINFKNGELRYRDCQWILEAHCREHYLATQLPHSYDSEAKAERFKRFLDEIFEGDDDAQDKAQLILEMIGYSLVCHTRYEKFILLVGPGANGKSVIMDVIRQIVGPELVSAVQPSQFARAFQRAHLYLKLINLVTEIAEGAVIADAELKAIVSGELTTVEHKNKPPFDMRPFATCWFGTNHMPHTRDFSNAIFRRALVVRFNRVFEDGVNADPHLREKLCREIPGIIRLALEAYGHVIAREGKFTEPQSCLDAKREWRYEADQAAQFVNECCDKDPDAAVPSKALYQAFAEWAKEEGIRITIKHKTFSSRLERLGFKLKRGTGGQRMIFGLRLKESDENEVFQ